MPILDRRKDRFLEDQDTRVSVGIDFPFGRVGNGDGYFKTTKTTVDSIKNKRKIIKQSFKMSRASLFLKVNFLAYVKIWKKWT